MHSPSPVGVDCHARRGPLRVLLVCLARYGGTLQCARRLAAGLTELDGVSVAYAGSADARYGGIDQMDRLRIPRLAVPTGQTAAENAFYSLDPRGHLSLHRFARGFRPDVVHYTVGHAWHAVLAPLLRRWPSVLTVHDPVRHPGEESRSYTCLMALDVSLADRIIVLSDVHRTQLLRFGKGPERVSVVHHGELAPPDGASPVPGKGVVLFAGRLIQYKGVEVLAEAFRNVLQQYPTARLVVAGRGVVSPRLAELSGHPNVQIRNEWVGDDELYRLCRECDFLVLPYLDATQSGVVALAQACGRAVIITRVGGLPEQIVEGVTGLVVSANDADALANAILSLLRNQELVVRMGSEAAALYKRRFSWRILAEETVGVYRMAIGDRTRWGRPRLGLSLMRAARAAAHGR